MKKTLHNEILVKIYDKMETTKTDEEYLKYSRLASKMEWFGAPFEKLPTHEEYKMLECLGITKDDLKPFQYIHVGSNLI